MKTTDSIDFSAILEYVVNDVPMERELTPEIAAQMGLSTTGDGSDYQKYRGKCKEMSEAAIAADPTLRLVRGYYHCPMWGKQPHWWTVRSDGSIFDPSVRQFPTKGIGAEYEEFDGMCECSNCGKRIPEENARIDGGYVFCSYDCHLRFVGL